jgi:HK97 family phage portal protein
MRWPWQQPEQKSSSLETVLRQMASLYETVSGVSVTPDNCMDSPTVQAIVTAVQNRLLISPVHVMRKSFVNGRAVKEELPSHPVARLLKRPNGWQTSEEYFSDAASSLLRHGKFFAFKGQGQTGPIQELVPMESGQTEIIRDPNTLNLSFRYQGLTIYQQRRVHYARLGSRNYYDGDSPVSDVRESIGLEIAAERFGSSFFGNGAMPFVYFKLMQGFSDFKTDEEKVRFLEGVKSAFGGNKKFSTMLLPKGMEMDALKVENDKAQFIETRKFIRTVIAGAFGVPPHLVGDLERATFNNVEQQDADFVINVIMPIAKRFEAAMERDLLTDDDRRSGVIIRFNLDAVQRADSKTRSESLKIEREMGVINVNEWREQTNRNPISQEDGGEDYIRPMNMEKPGDSSAETENAETSSPF